MQCTRCGCIHVVHLSAGLCTPCYEAERAQTARRLERRGAEVEEAAELGRTMAGIAKCTRCGARIIWARTESGKLMPLDAAPTHDGTCLLYREGGVTAELYCQMGVQFVATAPGRFYFPGRYVSHFATCPDAEKHRRGRRGGGK